MFDICRWAVRSGQGIKSTLSMGFFYISNKVSFPCAYYIFI